MLVITLIMVKYLEVVQHRVSSHLPKVGDLALSLFLLTIETIKITFILLNI